jgi:hypothetical protein
VELSSQSYSSPWLALSSGSPPTLSLEVKKHAGGSGPLSLRPSLRGSGRPSSRGGRPLLVDQTCYPRNTSKSFSAYKIDSLHSPRKRCAAHWDVLDPPLPIFSWFAVAPLEQLPRTPPPYLQPRSTPTPNPQPNPNPRPCPYSARSMLLRMLSPSPSPCSARFLLE